MSNNGNSGNNNNNNIITNVPAKERALVLQGGDLWAHMKQAHTRHYTNGFQRKIKKKGERKVQLLTSLK